MLETRSIIDRLSQINAPYSALTKINVVLMAYDHGDMHTRVPVFGFEQQKLILSDLRRIKGLTLIDCFSDSRFGSDYLGILSGESEGDFSVILQRLEGLAITNPFCKKRFDAAKKFRSECGDCYKPDGVYRLENLEHELVHFFQAVAFSKNLASSESSAEIEPYSCQLLYIQKPVFIPLSLYSYKFLKNYLAKTPEKEDYLGYDLNFGVPENFNVVEELSLSPILKKTLFEESSI